MKCKSDKEIKILSQGGKKLAQIMRELVKMCEIGIRASDLDEYAEKRIKELGGKPSFKGFGYIGQEFPNTLCVSANEMVVHGIPRKDLVFKEGDLIGLDIGMQYKGLFTDHAVTVPIGRISHDAQRLLEAAEECLKIGIEQCKVNNHLGDIGCAIQEFAEEKGFGVVKKLTGHAVGYAVHENPKIPNYGKRGSGEKLEQGAVLAIEPMINLGTDDVKIASDGWGVITADNKYAAHFEHTVAVDKDGPRILTI